MPEKKPHVEALAALSIAMPVAKPTKISPKPHAATKPPATKPDASSLLFLSRNGTTLERQCHTVSYAGCPKTIVYSLSAKLKFSKTLLKDHSLPSSVQARCKE